MKWGWASSAVALGSIKIIRHAKEGIEQAMESTSLEIKTEF